MYMSCIYSIIYMTWKVFFVMCYGAPIFGDTMKHIMSSALFKKEKDLLPVKLLRLKTYICYICIINVLETLAD